MKKLKIAYFGTPEFSARFLEKLLTDASINPPAGEAGRLIEVKLVVTQPDQPVGREQRITKSPVKIVAEKFDIPVIDSPDVTSGSPELYSSSPEIKFGINYVEKNFKNIDLGLIYYYGQIIPKKLLSIPKFGFWNIHFSLLPKLRGTTPATFSLILGDKKTAVSFVQTDEKLDHGDLIAQHEVKINPDETRIQLEERLHNISYKIFVEQINNLLNNKIKLTPQDHSQATYTRFPTKNDGFIPFATLKKALNNDLFDSNDLPAIIKKYYSKYNVPILQRPSSKGNSSQVIFNMFRGFFPWPGIWTVINIKGTEKRLKITDMDYSNDKLLIKKVQLEGKKEVDFETFNRAYQLF